MQKIQYESVAILQEKNWWYRARRDLLKQVIKSLPNKNKALEIGCGMGGNLKVIKEYFKETQGIDNAAIAVEYCKKEGLSVRKAAGEKLKFKDNYFDFIVCADVLEHIPEDQKAVDEIARILKPNGFLFITVPAHSYLWNNNDIRSEHVRRYEKAQIRKLVKEKFNIKKISYWNCTLFLPNLITSKLEKKKTKKNNLELIPKSVDQILYYCMKIENKIIKHASFLPQGVSIICLAQKCAEKPIKRGSA
ncbi:class I SAM-dependent methyltransferase [Candidatus Woesearchaeota archaeon]|nr:class I SAM-dependent methyltransferase [Candidatus Woesearchaeota archaeon]